MKGHILAALSEELERWEELLASLKEEQITVPQPDSGWSIKDDMAHLMAWQQRSIARLEAALTNQEPEFPAWRPDLDPEEESNTDPVNAWIYEHYRERPWSQVHQEWMSGFQRFLDAAHKIPEKDLLDSSRYPWMKRRPLALVLVGSYDHHHEHLEKLQAWLEA